MERPKQANYTSNYYSHITFNLAFCPLSPCAGLCREKAVQPVSLCLAGGGAWLAGNNGHYYHYIYNKKLTNKKLLKFQYKAALLSCDIVHKPKKANFISTIYKVTISSVRQNSENEFIDDQCRSVAYLTMWHLC